MVNKTRVRKHRRNGRIVKCHRRRIKNRIKKKGLFSNKPRERDEMGDEEYMARQAIDKTSREAVEFDPLDVGIITKGVKEDFDAGYDKKKGSRWGGWSDED